MTETKTSSFPLEKILTASVNEYFPNYSDREKYDLVGVHCELITPFNVQSDSQEIDFCIKAFATNVPLNAEVVVDYKPITSILYNGCTSVLHYIASGTALVQKKK